MNKGLTQEGGTKLISASFSEINADGVQMANLKPKGYENNVYFTTENAGTFGDFTITFLDEGGVEVGIYSWYQDYTAGEWQEGYWYEDMNEMGEGYFDTIPVGMSMFFTSPTPEEGESYTLPTSGEVVTKKIDYALPEGTCQWGNPRASAISIYDLVPMGYLDNQYFTGENGGTFGDFTITFLNEGGEEIGIYSWYHTYESGSWLNDGTWYEDMAAESTDLQPGDGVFVTGAFHDGDGDVGSNPYYISLPKQEL